MLFRNSQAYTGTPKMQILSLFWGSVLCSRTPPPIDCKGRGSFSRFSCQYLATAVELQPLLGKASLSKITNPKITPETTFLECACLESQEYEHTYDGFQKGNRLRGMLKLFSTNTRSPCTGRDPWTFPPSPDTLHLSQTPLNQT